MQLKQAVNPGSQWQGNPILIQQLIFILELIYPAVEGGHRDPEAIRLKTIRGQRGCQDRRSAALKNETMSPTGRNLNHVAQAGRNNVLTIINVGIGTDPCAPGDDRPVIFERQRVPAPAAMATTLLKPAGMLVSP